ncbi:hypothetical protein PSHT_03739 [Puccinia striiformis]|uniref:CCHC-type domain-containing protein n=1 Tax=Puccinia striiformis TaxID=27350 RepID=A0A2S4WET0_9BASI|nr:hypothetical protein PSHT_03739 [Puccinia striiformis]
MVKNAIENKYGTESWKLKLRDEFDADRFHLNNPKILHEWFTTQKERLRGFSPELSNYIICQKILKQCPGPLIHAVKSRYKKPDEQMTFEEMVIIVEEIIDQTYKHYRNNNNNNNQNSRGSWKDNNQYKKKDNQKSDTDPKKTTSAPVNTQQIKNVSICNSCKQPGHYSRECPKRKTRVNNVGAGELENQEEDDSNQNQDEEQSEKGSLYDAEQDFEPESFVGVIENGDGSHLMDLGLYAIECDISPSFSIAEIQAEAHQPQTWDSSMKISNIEDARLMKCKPDQGKAHLIGKTNLTTVIIKEKEFPCLLDSGAACSIISQQLLEKILPDWEESLLPINQAQFHSSSDQLEARGIIELPIIFPHTKGSMRIQTEFVVMKNARIKYLILGNDYLTLYGIDITNSKERYFTIGNENKKKKFSFKNNALEENRISSDIAAVKQHAPSRQDFISGDLAEAHISQKLTLEQKESLITLLFNLKDAFATTDQPLGAIKGHEVNIELTTHRPYPPLLRRPPYSASPRSREALEQHIEELVRLNVLRKVGHNEVVEITTPVIIAWHNGKSKMVGDFRALNTYTAADRYPIPKISETLNNLARARFITSMDVLKGFHQNLIAENSKKFSQNHPPQRHL